MGLLRPTRLVIGLTAMAILASAGPALAASNPAGLRTTAASPWAATATTATHLRNAISLGAAPAATSVPVTVTLFPRQVAALNALIVDQANPASSSYHRYLNPAGFAARFGATPAQIAAVTSYLRSAGLASMTVSPNHLEVTAQATARSATQAFHTSLGLFSLNNRTILANTAPALVPRALAGVISGVIGLNQAQSAHGFTSRVRPNAVIGGTFTPPDLATAYDATSLPPAAGSTLAIMAEGDLTQVVKDLRTEEAAHGLPQVPVTIVPSGKPSSDTSGVIEWDLDTQTSTAMAGNVKMLYIYDAPSLADNDIANEITQFVSQKLALAGSASFGECDAQARSDGLARAVDVALEEAAVQGQTLFASSGDTGSTCAVTGGILDGLLPSSPETSFPASGTYTAGVGGTTLVTTGGGAYAGETAWSGSGGGVSAEAPGPWTTVADHTAPATRGPLTRGVPDLAMDANPNTGARIVVDGQVVAVGGTSLSSPLALGAWIRINAAHGNTLGPATPALYGLYNLSHPSGAGGATPGLHEIVAGNNGDYRAGPGYNLVTGLGTIDVAALNRVL